MNTGFLFDDASEERPSRSFNGVHIELHAQDRDNAGRGWAAVIDSVSGKAHRQSFEISCVVESLELKTIGKGTNRRDAEQQAASSMLVLIGDRGE